MNFNRHLELEGKHAIVSPSRYYSLLCDDDRFIQYCTSYYAQTLGTTLHEFAAKRISMGMRLHKSDSDSVLFYLRDHGIPPYAIDIQTIMPNLIQYVNDAIGFRTTPEVTLKYSQNCFGTTDSIAFQNNVLRIQDYKSGVTPAKMEQLLAYASLFCLEYNIKPQDISTELRLYQSNEVRLEKPEPDVVEAMMERIVSRDAIIKSIE